MFRKSIDRILAAVLILSIFTIGGVTMALNAKSFGYSLVKGYTNYLKDDGRPLAGVSARISALTGAINRTLLGKDTFQSLNLRLQMALGKQMYSLGGTTMVKLKTGQLYDLLGKTNIRDDVDKMVKLSKSLQDLSIPMLYVYPHSYLYEDNMLPDGVTDGNIQAADDLVTGLRGAGTPVVDSREVYRAAGLTLDQAIYRTDQHWATNNLFATFQATAEKLTEMGIAIDPALYASDNFKTDVYARMHMGQVGERLGPSLITPDDFVLMQPSYETALHKKIVNGSITEDESGSFSDLLNWKLIDDAKRDGVANLYSVYGNHDAENWYVNDKVPTGRILISKDSYGTPFVDFLALTAHEVLAIDLRKGSRTIEDYAREFKPDIVIVAHSQAMLREANYVFVE
jgi:hypothetical protein